MYGVDIGGSDGWSWTFTFDNGIGFYEFYTRAWDDRGNYEEAPPDADARAGYDNAGPTRPQPVLPENGSTIWESHGRPRFEWTRALDNVGAFPGSGVTYRLQVATDSGFASIVYDRSGIVDNFHVLENSLPQGVYYWRVIAVDGAGNENRSGVFWFELRVPPVSRVEPIEPYWNRDDLIWIEVNASDNDGQVENVELWYRYSADNVSWGAWILYDYDASAPYQFIFVFGSEGFYEFYSRAWDNAGNYEEAPAGADARCGYDATPPPAPAPRSPENCENVYTTTPLLEWTDVSDLSGVYYELQIDDSSDFGSPLYSINGLAENWHVVENALPVRVLLYWRVRAVNGSGLFSEWSEVYVFSVQRVWRILEGWGTSVEATAVWRMKKWSTSVQSPVTGWKEAEGWTGTGAALSGAWAVYGSWKSTVQTLVGWKSTSGWRVRTTGRAEWIQSESWSAEISTVTQWSMVEALTGTVQSIQGRWSAAEILSVAVSGPVSYTHLTLPTTERV